MRYRTAKATICKDNNLYFVFNTKKHSEANTLEDVDKATLSFFNKEINYGYVGKKEVDNFNEWKKEVLRHLNISTDYALYQFKYWSDLEQKKEIEIVYNVKIGANK